MLGHTNTFIPLPKFPIDCCYGDGENKLNIKNEVDWRVL